MRVFTVLVFPKKVVGPVQLQNPKSQPCRPVNKKDKEKVVYDHASFNYNW